MNTAHPIEIQVWRRLAVEEPDALWKSYGVLALLDALAAAEARATRAEAQSAIRGRTIAYARKRAREAEAERDAARGYISELETAVQSRNEVITHRDARINAVRESAQMIREACDRWEVDGDDERLVNDVLDPWTNRILEGEA